MSQLRLSQTYVLAGNVGIPNVVWQLGTLDTYFGDLGLYDFRPAQIFFETVGLSARYQTDKFELLIGGGDSGYAIRRDNYNTLFTGGGTLRYRPINRLEVGVGGQYRFEPSVQGNRAAPYSTPDVGYEEVIRGEVLLNYTEENPYRLLEFPNPVPTTASSMKAIGYLGFGGFGPVIWNNFYATYERLHPDGPVMENFQGQDFMIHITELTDERTVFFVGNELQLAEVFLNGGTSLGLDCTATTKMQTIIFSPQITIEPMPQPFCVHRFTSDRPYIFCSKPQWQRSFLATETPLESTPILFS